ncbi:hypothetical protein FJ417_32320, partial [Mesorhizobium sp. B3-1-7]
MIDGGHWALADDGARRSIAQSRVPSRPPLACRPSPPLGGRSAAFAPRSSFRRWRLAKAGATSNLPPGGGDVRQDRGGRRRALALPGCHSLAV